MRIVIWHPSQIIADGYAAGFQRFGVEIVGVVDTIEQLAQLSAAENPQLILTRTTVAAQIPLLRKMLQRFTTTAPKIVLIGTHISGADLISAISAGADGVVELDGEPQLIIHRLTSVLYNSVSSDQLFPADWRSICPLLSKIARDSFDAEILSQLIEGKPNREIANRLGYSSQTINNRVSSILTRGEVSSRTELVARLHCTSCTGCESVGTTITSLAQSISEYAFQIQQ